MTSTSHRIKATQGDANAKKKGIGEEYNLIIRDYLKEKRKINTGNWNDLKSTPKGWEYDWENYFPLVCNKRLKAACYSIDLQHFFDLTIEDDDAGKQSKRAPSLYFSNQILSPISLRNRIIHSLERYIVSKREQRKSFHRTPIGLGYAMRYSLATGELLNIGQEETVEIDSRDKKEIEIPIFGYSSEQNKLVLNKDRKWEWNIFDRELVLFIWTLIVLLIAIYSIGLILFPHDSKPSKISLRRKLLFICSLLFSIYLSTGLFSNKIYA